MNKEELKRHLKVITGQKQYTYIELVQIAKDLEDTRIELDANKHLAKKEDNDMAYGILEIEERQLKEEFKKRGMK